MFATLWASLDLAMVFRMSSLTMLPLPRLLYSIRPLASAMTDLQIEVLGTWAINPEPKDTVPVGSYWIVFKVVLGLQNLSRQPASHFV